MLEDFKNDYEVKYPHAKWPIRYVVTDFSYALLNAICKAWNGVALIKYINLTYKFPGDDNFKEKLSDYNIETLLELCCGHFSKTQCNDVTKYFPSLQRENQSFLKEVLIAMYDVGDASKYLDKFVHHPSVKIRGCQCRKSTVIVNGNNLGI